MTLFKYQKLRKMKRAILHILISGFIGHSFANITTPQHPYKSYPDVLRVNILNPSRIISKSETDAKIIIIAPCSDPNKKEHKNSQAVILNSQANFVEETSGRKPIRKNRPFRSRKGLITYHAISLQPKFIRLKIPP